MAPYRGAGRPQATFFINRLFDKAADQFVMDPAEIRFKNFIQPDEFPYRTGLISRDGTAMQLDSGDYPALLTILLDKGHYQGWREEQLQARNARNLLGIRLSVAIQNTAL